MKHPWMPLYWGDFLANTMHLTAQEVGAYMLLMGHAWEHGGVVPIEKAQRIARVSNRQWPKVRAALEPLFELQCAHVGTQMYALVRVSRELHKADEISNKRKDAALQMHSKSRANGYANGDAKHLTSTATTTIEKLSNGKGSEAAPPPAHSNYRDPGVDYRAPPRTKSDNPLTPIPDRPLAAVKRP